MRDGGRTGNSISLVFSSFSGAALETARCTTRVLTALHPPKAVSNTCFPVPFALNTKHSGVLVAPIVFDIPHNRSFFSKYVDQYRGSPLLTMS